MERTPPLQAQRHSPLKSVEVVLEPLQKELPGAQVRALRPWGLVLAAAPAVAARSAMVPLAEVVATRAAADSQGDPANQVRAEIREVVREPVVTA